MSFKISDKVVFIGPDGPIPPQDQGKWLCGHKGPLVIGQIYVVRDIGVNEFSDGRHCVLFLAGRSLVWIPDGKEYGYVAKRFRKLSEIQSENKASREHLLKIEASKLGHSLIFV